MAKLNKHGLKIVGIKKASSETRELGYTGVVNIIKYDRETGTIWTVAETSNTFWRFSADSTIMEVCRSAHHMTMQDIADALYCTITGDHSLWGNWQPPRSQYD